MKKKQQTFEKVVTWATGVILQKLIEGELREGVTLVVMHVAQWTKDNMKEAK